MTISYSKFWKPLRGFARAGLVSTVSVMMVLAPVSAHAEVSFFNAGNGLESAAKAASSGVSALTAMQGANSMSKGQQQMQCCKEGCDGAGKEATANKAGQDAAAKGAADSLPKSDGSVPMPKPNPNKPLEPIPWQPSPSGAWNLHPSSSPVALICTRAPAKAKMLFELFRPTKVQAAAGCNDAMMAMAQGAMQMLSALAGLAAAAMSGNNAKKNGTSASNLAETPTAPQVTAAGNTSLGNGTGNSAPIQIDPALLRDGKGAAIAAEFEKNFGIPAQSFANAFLGGADPRAMLMNAPKNALSADTMNQAFSAAKSMSADQKAAALAGLTDLQNAATAKMADAIDAAGKGTSASRKPSSSGDLDPLDDLAMGDKAAGTGADGVNSQLSPELQAALAARDTAEARDNSTIFQVVHAKYQEKIRMIYGFDAHGHSIGGKGVADANGF